MEQKHLKLVPLLLFTAHSCRLLHNGTPNIHEAVTLGILALATYFSNKQDVDKDQAQLKQEVRDLTLRVNKYEKDTSDLSSHVSSLKLGSTYTKLTGSKI